MVLVRETKETDFQTIVELNGAEEQQTSPMGLERLRVLHEIADYHRVAVVDGRVQGFLLTMGEGADYRNDNFSWFARRYSRFIYIDRIVVAKAFAGRGIGTVLYEDLMENARRSGIKLLACEYNVDPPNIPSQNFHDRMGFKEVGTQRVAQGTKLVSLQIAQLAMATGEEG